MSLIERIKSWFPHPKIAPKRYIALAGIIIYTLAKVYVSLTPDPLDDDYPDEVRQAVMMVIGGADPSSIQSPAEA